MPLKSIEMTYEIVSNRYEIKFTTKNDQEYRCLFNHKSFSFSASINSVDVKDVDEFLFKGYWTLELL